MSRRVINWFPGHMAKARRWVTEALPRTDLVLEVVDARLPQSSQNPMIQEICAARPRLTVFCKADLADPEITKRWLAAWPLPAVALNTKEPKLRKGLLRDIRAQFSERGGPGKTLRVLVVGIPNVGKSSIVNFLSQRRITQVGDEPAITRKHQQIDLKNGILLIDTPGVLWPKIEDQNTAYRLALGGTIKESILDSVDVAVFAADYLASAYGNRVAERFKLDGVPVDPVQLLEAVGRKRGLIRKGGEVDFERAAKTFLLEIRSGKLGRLSLEAP